MQDSIPALLVGGALVIVGVALMISHVVVRRRSATDPDLDEHDRRHYHRRFRRRMQTSGLIAVIGAAIAVGDLWPALKNSPVLFGFYWLAVLMLTAWVVLLGVGDLLSVRSHSHASLQRLRQQQRALEEEAARLRRHNSNGHGAQS